MPIGLDCRDDLTASYTELYIRFGDSPLAAPMPLGRRSNHTTHHTTHQ